MTDLRKDYPDIPLHERRDWGNGIVCGALLALLVMLLWWLW